MICIVSVLFVFQQKKAYAKHTLPGIETIAENTGYYNPYIILEVVENKEDAALGYLIGGEEPIKEGKSIKDYSTEAERISDFPVDEADLIPDLYDNLNGNAFSATLINTAEETNSVDVKGKYVSAINGDYTLVETAAFYSAYDPVEDIGKQRYDLYATFLDEGNGSYIPTFTEIGTTALLDVDIDTGVETKTYKNYCKYEIDDTYISVELNASTDLSLYDGELIFDATPSGYVYKGKIVKQSISGEPLAYVLGANGEKYLFEDISGYSGYVLMPQQTIGTYEILSFTFNPAAGTHYISFFGKASVDNMTDYSYEESWYASDVGAYVQETPASSEYVYSDGAGDLNWVTDYSEGTLLTYTYSGGFDNYEWFKKNVFDREDTEIDGLVIDVKTVTMDELNAYNLDLVDMVYFSGIDADYSIDMTDEQAIKLFTMFYEDHFPILMNRSTHDLLMNRVGAYSNMQKLELLLSQTSYEIINATALVSNWTSDSYWTTISGTVRAADALYGLNYVNQSFYMYDDTNYKGTDAIPFINEDFLTAFTDPMVTQGFQPVIDEIISENFYIQIAGYIDTLPEEVTKAGAMRYIINYGYKRNVIKTRISVLEIEPCYSYKYSDSELSTVVTLNKAADNRTGTNRNTFTNVIVDRNILSNEYIAENWATQFIDNQDKIELTQTYTAEFIGKIEDLNESYDLIYIGLDTSTMNTELNYSGGKYYKSEDTLYNNTSLDGLIYLHSGDYLTMTDSYVLRGLLNPNNVSLENYMDGYGKYALSGNDITLEKYNALCEYMDAGYPVIFADEFYNLDTAGMAISVNTNKIDSASYMYQIAKYALDQGYFGGNVNVDQNITNDITGTGAKETLANYLNISKLSIELTAVPTVYDGTLVSPAYLNKTGGIYQLEYQFQLKDDSAIIDQNTNYNVKLYIDSSVDGRFYSDEEILGLKIYELRNGSYVQIYQNNGKFELLAGKYYKVIREVPTGYVGVLPWKLVLSRNDNALVRKSVTGYTAIATETVNRETIKVLQLLATSDYANNNWNLQTSSSFNTLLDQVQDFDIQITSVPVSQYIRSGTETNDNLHYTYLNDYDMIVIGFSDGYSFTAPEVTNTTSRKNLQANAALAIRKYISEGRSVLFTHDTTSYCNTTDFNNTVRSDGSLKTNDPNNGAWLWGYEFNRYVRDVVGMDRYGVLRNVDGLSPVNTVYDKMWQSNTLQEVGNTYPYIQGYSEQTVVQYASANDYVYTTRPNVAGSGGQYSNAMYVTKTNEGQITRYPFDIPEEFQVTNTHRQYYQLNLDTDSKDAIKDDDIVVWYCISDVANTQDIYETKPNDVRNNYYIYNKGNVTYSGVGHSTVLDARVTEMKLFVNTMVAAYNAGVHPPKVTYKDGADDDARVIEYLYLPYDEALSEYIDTTVDIYFDIADTSFVQGTKDITAYYYLEVSASSSSTITVTVDGEQRYLQEFLPDLVTNINTGAASTGDAVHIMDNDSRNMFTLTEEDLNLLNKNRANIYVGAKTTYTRSTGTGEIEVSETQFGYYKVGILKAQLFELE